MTEMDTTAPTPGEGNADDGAAADTSAAGGRIPKRDFDIPYRYDVTATTAEVVAAHSDIEDGAETGISVSVAGRIMLKRDQGKLVFADLQDGTGRIQIFGLSLIHI